MSGDIDLKATGEIDANYIVETRDTVKYLKMHKTAPHLQDISAYMSITLG